MPERVLLEGTAVRLDPLELSHVDELLAAASEDRSTYGFTLVPNDELSMREYVSTALEDEQSGWALPFAIRSSATGRVVGSSRFLDLDYWGSVPVWPPGRPVTGGAGTPSVAEIGSTWLAASAQRTAINTEVKLLMLQHAFDGWEVERVTFKTDARNARSRRSIERVGATFEGIRRAHLRATDGSIRDSAYYSILRAEWPAVEQALLARGVTS
ncbi:MAG: GNAT family N-acetyltransferase [Acidimicrobiia bacterium]